MEYSENRKKLMALASKEPSGLMGLVNYQIENEVWLTIVSGLAIKVLSKIRELKINKEELSITSGIHIDELNNILKGRENMKIGSITKLEKALGITLI